MEHNELVEQGRAYGVKALYADAVEYAADGEYEIAERLLAAAAEVQAELAYVG